MTARPAIRVFAPLAAAAVLCWPGMARAHVSEGAFVLLLPTDIYIVSGCLSVLATIAIVSVTPKRALDRLFTTLRLPLPDTTGRLSDGLSLLSMLALLALCLIGLFGPRDPLRNLLPLTVWTGFWIVLITLGGVLGNHWRALNPWSGLCRLLFGRRDAPPLRLPEVLGASPAIVTFLAVFGFYMADPAPTDPGRLARVVLLYWGANLSAMALFGCETWLRRGEAFSVLFDQLSRVALFRRRTGLRLGMPGWRIVDAGPVGVTVGAFALVVLGAGSFDGLKETFRWMGFIGVNPLDYPGRSAVVTSSLTGLAISAAVLVLSFVAVMWAGRILAQGKKAGPADITTRQMFCTFAPTILPIALAFHVSHFTVSLLIDGQYLLAALSDPLGTGADLFGTAHDHVTAGFLTNTTSVRKIWLFQAGAVVLGHIVAVVIAHQKALSLFPTQRQAALSQIPLGAFMILYTWFGLWLLASPRAV